MGEIFYFIMCFSVGIHFFNFRDPGSSMSERSILDEDTLSNSRGQVKRIDWMIKREGE